jgi:PhnB protein
MPNYKPEGYHSVTPYLIIRDAVQAIEFYKTVFSATESVRFPTPDGRIGHAEITIGDSLIMLADEFPDMGFTSPSTLGGSPVNICLYVPDVDVTVAAALSAGGTITQPVEDKFYGDRAGAVKDPFGFTWNIMTHVRDVSMEEIQAAAEKLTTANSSDFHQIRLRRNAFLSRKLFPITLTSLNAIASEPIIGLRSNLNAG